MDRIRNFSIIAHIDHGKSTLADRMLEITGTVEARKMREQVLDSMELERERGITIKMQPVRMDYTHGGQSYILNLIDTPGHIDFSYEVSRALKAVEGSILLVDATQGVQAQTLTTLSMAREAGLVIIPAVSKVDSPLARVEEVKLEVAALLDIDPDTVMEVSGKTGAGVAELLAKVIERIPPPTAPAGGDGFRALVFDFKYSNHTGVIVFVRVMNGSVRKADQLLFIASNQRFAPISVGVFTPDETEKAELQEGEIGYLVTGIKEPGIATVGDTVTAFSRTAQPLEGYMSPRPVVWASLYPESQDDFPTLKLALSRLKLSDSSFSYEEESSGALGRGFRCGFLGMLHLEIITERLKREFSLSLIITTPSITYQVTDRKGVPKLVYSAVHFPDDHEISAVLEPWVTAIIIAPASYISSLMQILFDHEASVLDTETFGDERTRLTIEMPLRELMRNFFDTVKSVSSGYASISYEVTEMRPADVTRMDILVAEEPVPAFARIVSRRLAEAEAEAAVVKLEGILPRQLITTKIQAKVYGRIIASRTIAAMRKDVTGYLYGGDISRKKKLWEKQKKGKKRMQAEGRVNIPHDVFLKMMKAD
jgi:GTP-binding protein LepA